MSVTKWVLSLVLTVPVFAAPEHYTVDPEHTYPSLEMPHMGLSIWRGKFNHTTGTITFDPVAKTGSVDIRVDAASIDFGHDKMNEFALGADWLDVAKFPTMTYGGVLQFDDAEPVAVDGQLTLRGVTRPVTLKINSFTCIEKHPFMQKKVCGADAEADLDRAEFGMTQYTEGGAGKIHLRIQIEGMRSD